jgi:hypothetical protein
MLLTLPLRAIVGLLCSRKPLALRLWKLRPFGRLGIILRDEK